MLKSIFAIALLGMLMAFTPRTTQQNPYFKHIDITLTSSQGCVFHVVGEASINIFRGKLTSFTGTITMSGPGACPRGTYTVSYSSLNYDNLDGGNIQTKGEMALLFDTNDLCNISSVKFIAGTPSKDTEIACDAVNSTKEVKSSLIDAIKEGDCR